MSNEQAARIPSAEMVDMKLAWGEEGDSVAALTMQRWSLYLTPEWSAIWKVSCSRSSSKVARVTTLFHALMPHSA
jgi:hypothetical protein